MPGKATKDRTLADDLLIGAAAIAEFVYGDESERKKIYHNFNSPKSDDKLPLFKMGAIICGRKSRLLQHIEEREGRSNR